MNKNPNLNQVTIIIEKSKRRVITKAPLSGVDKIVFVVNRQFTNAPNTTQIASGAGRSSAAGSNAAIKSPHTNQQQSVGAGGKAKNIDIKGGGRYNANRARSTGKRTGKEVVVVINDQIVKVPKGTKGAAATQVASGAGKYSTGGTNSAIESAGTKQQHAVGGGGTAINKRSRKGKTTRIRNTSHRTNTRRKR